MAAQGKQPFLHIRITPEEKERFEAAAANEGYREVSSWVRKCLNTRANEVIPRPKKLAR
jgi:uncharacterized protein (DUF1778 family)